MVLRREDHLLAGREKDGREGDVFGYLLADGPPLVSSSCMAGPWLLKRDFSEQIFTPRQALSAL